MQQDPSKIFLATLSRCHRRARLWTGTRAYCCTIGRNSIAVGDQGETSGVTPWRCQQKPPRQGGPLQRQQPAPSQRQPPRQRGASAQPAAAAAPPPAPAARRSAAWTPAAAARPTRCWPGTPSRWPAAWAWHSSQSCPPADSPQPSAHSSEEHSAEFSGPCALRPGSKLGRCNQEQGWADSLTDRVSGPHHRKSLSWQRAALVHCVWFRT